MKAKASGTPAKLAATPENVVAPGGHAGSPGPDGGVRHQEAEQATEHRRDQADLDARLKGVDVLRRMDDLRDVLRREGACSSLKAPTRTTADGSSRNATESGEERDDAEPGERQPSPAGRPARPCDGLCRGLLRLRGPRSPLRCHDRLRVRDLLEARELHARIERGRGQRLRQRRRDHLPRRQVGEAGGVRVPLEEQQLSDIGVEELLPEPRSPRVWRSRVDRLAVVLPPYTPLLGIETAALEVRIRLFVTELVVVPVERDGRLTRRHRLRRHVDWLELPGLRELREEVHARRDVAQRATVGECSREDAENAAFAFRGSSFSATLWLKLELRRSRPVGRRLVDDAPGSCRRPSLPSNRPSRSRARLSSREAPS